MRKNFVLIFLAITTLFLSLNINIVRADELTPSAIIKYDLPYPGILPDNPLYKLKVLRDKIIASFINDPQKKIDFYLLQTDKGILAAAMLIDKNEIKLAEDTLFKAENNFTLLTYQFNKFANKPNPEFFSKLEKASLKHQEVIMSLIKRVPENEQKDFPEGPCLTALPSQDQASP